MSTSSNPSNVKPRGLLNESVSIKQFKLDYYVAPEGLQELVSSVWHVSWDLPPGHSYLQSNLPHPVQHIVLDPLRGSGLYGCVTKRFDYEISNTGEVLGFKLFPGMGRAFVDMNLSNLTDDRLPLEELIGTEFTALSESALDGNTAITTVLDSVAEILAQRVGKISQPMIDVCRAVKLIENVKEICRVTDLVDYLEMSVRQIQRQFSTYVGVSPKWVIDRYRILEAVTEMNSGEHTDVLELAIKLGYSDQSHFSNKFKKISGFTPVAYQERQKIGSMSKLESRSSPVD